MHITQGLLIPEEVPDLHRYMADDYAWTYYDTTFCFYLCLVFISIGIGTIVEFITHALRPIDPTSPDFHTLTDYGPTYRDGALMEEQWLVGASIDPLVDGHPPHLNRY